MDFTIFNIILTSFTAVSVLLMAGCLAFSYKQSKTLLKKNRGR
ncbi:hypothetical protein [Lactococcus termiticola]|uniref:Uncharacterized protein n=1 Tax=Lactococcus termiticola TaxID=2169526 RepID=A0A2R5HIN2_9LACT|nr:hypothetical protein [Lactococcus termiticola]GBG96218.1 hypothetical protein NtB2_00329 [Lactococcus termiticola]